MLELFRARSTNGVVLEAPRRPASIASAIGRGLGDLGQAIGTVAADNERASEAEAAADAEVTRIEQERLRSRRTVEFGAALAEARLEYARQSQEARGQTAPGAPEWESRATEIREAVFGGLLEPYSDDPELAQELGRSVQSVTGNIAVKELEWELEQRSEWEGTAYDKALQVEADTLVDDPGQLLVAADRMATLLGGTDFDGTTKAKIGDLTLAKLSNSAFEGMERRGAFDQIEALLKSGEFDGALGKSKSAWLDRVDAGREQLARAAEAAELDVQRAALEQAAQVTALVDAHEDVPASRFAEVAEQMRAAGVPESDVIEFLGKGKDAVRNNAVRGLSTPQIETSIASLQSKINSGAASAEDEAQLKALQDQLDMRDDDAASGLTGLSSKNVAEQGMAIDTLSQMPEARRFAAAEKAGDKGAALLAGLPPRNRAVAIQGRQVRANNSDAYMPPNTKGEHDKGLLDAEFRRALGPKLTAQLIQEDMYVPAREAAADMFVGYQAQQGGGGRWDRNSFNLAVTMMFGARPRPDGRWPGGLGTVRGKRVELPDRYTTDEFDSVYSAMSFNGAAYDNGSDAKKADILANFTPVYMTTDDKGVAYYQLHNSTGRPLFWKGTTEPYAFPMRPK